MTPCIIALTMGDPAGIGPEITQSALTRLMPWLADNRVEIHYYGPEVFVRGLPVFASESIALNVQPIPGKGDGQNGPIVINSIERAVEDCRKGLVHAVVTNPINKAVLYDIGFKFPGHTEFLAELCKIKHPSVMMLSSDQLNVVPITLHTSLYDAIESIRRHGAALIKHAVRITYNSLKERGVQRPRLAISGLNPHAGEQGAMGWEEIQIITPTIDTLRAELDISILGPMPADTMFDSHNRKKYDVALAMTHDQALIPLKTLAFDSGVNTTLGLPIIRTSPDHGTAYDIAGKGVARPDSLMAAIQKAVELARASRSF